MGEAKRGEMMPNRNYINGANFERRVKKELEEQGWLCFRTAGSHGVADVIAIQGGRVPRLIQCKLTGKISRTDRSKLKEVANEAGAVPMICWREKEGRKYIIKYKRL